MLFQRGSTRLNGGSLPNEDKMRDLLKSTGRYLKKNVFHFKCSDFLRENDTGLYIEDYFQEMVYLERRRSERTGRPFILMLVDIGGALSVTASQAAAAAHKICTMTREVDIKGWYRHNHVLGVIFTETPASATEQLRTKVLSGLSAEDALGTGAAGLKLTFHAFPEKSGGSGAIPVDFELYPDLKRRNEVKKRPLTIKRAIDVIGSLFGIVLFSPFFIAIAVIIKLTSRGPVLYKQKRIGEFGREFTFLKFRSMYQGANDKLHSEYVKKLIREDKAYSGSADGERQVFKIKDDPRITPIGRFLRKTSLDELPQFFNVLRGDMSLVGPRPPIPYELEDYSLWHWRRVIEAKPGVTGLWQVMGRSMTSYNDMVRLDLRYIERWSIWLDIKIILLTPFSMVSSKGAY